MDEAPQIYDEFNVQEYSAQANEIAEMYKAYGAVPDTSKFERIEVNLKLQDDEVAELRGAYNQAEAVDLWLAKNGVLEPQPEASFSDTRYVGPFSGSVLSYQSRTSIWDNDLDLERDWVVVERPRAVKSGTPIWSVSREPNGPGILTTDRRSEIEAVKAELEAQREWTQIAENAEKHKQELETAWGRAREDIKNVIREFPITTVKPGETITVQWLGLEAEVSASRNTTRYESGVVPSFNVTLPTGQSINLAQDGSWPTDVREIAQTLKNLAESTRPNDVVVPGETNAGAYDRLQNFLRDEDSLPKFPKGVWDTSGFYTRLYEDVDQTPFLEMPDFPGEKDADGDLRTHNLMLIYPDREPERIEFHQIMMRGGNQRFVGEVTGRPRPEDTIKDIYHNRSSRFPDVDLTRAKLEWIPVEKKSS